MASSDDSTVSVNFFLKVIPLLSITGVAFALLDKYFYYSNFGIDILGYLMTSEILLSLPSVVLPITMVVFPFLLGFYLPQKESPKQNVQKVIFKLFNHKYLLPTLVMFFLIGFVGIYIVADRTDSLSPFQFTSFFLISLYVIWNWLIKPSYPKKVVYLFVFILSIVYLLIKNKLSAHNIYKGHAKYEINLVVGGKSFKSDSILLYLGSTANYYYFWNQNEKSAKIISKSNVTEANLKKLRDSL